MASPTPVLPEVGSTITPPGLSLPARSAVSTMRSAIRSLTEPPGFRYSTFTRTFGVLATPAVTDFSRISGVFPITSVSELCTCTWLSPCYPLSAAPVPPIAPVNVALTRAQGGANHARGSHRRSRPLPDRPGLQGVADLDPARRPARADGVGG